MSGCTQTDKKQISVLMAVYNPRRDWLREQLRSLDMQSYPNIRLYIRDDCSTDITLPELEEIASENIRNFPYSIVRNEKNLGSNGTFERLTEEADGEYFAYCDQDDIWLPEKLKTLQGVIESSEAELVCSDMFVIDGDGNRTADSITKSRRHHVFRSGDGIADRLIVSNWVTGCTMLVRAEAAKSAVPFCPYMVHDQYIALCCAERGKIVSLPDRLINYRIHNGNQTLMMAGVTDRESYLHFRIELMKNRCAWLRDNFSCSAELKGEIEKCHMWACARENNWKHSGGAGQIIRYRKFSPLTSLFEVGIVHLPDFLFRAAIDMKKKNIL